MDERFNEAREEEEKEKKAFMEIDWHDFVIVETVEFNPEDEGITLPGPMSLNGLLGRDLVQKKRELGGGGGGGNGRGEARDLEVGQGGPEKRLKHDEEPTSK